ncbi:MAG: isochorismatase family protein [Gammaproteobacteria bacterium]
MSTHDAALLVIDAQQSFEHRPYWNASETEPFFNRLQFLVDGAKSRHIPVVQIFHVEDVGVFSLDSGYVRTLAALSIAPDVVFHKHRHSALVGSGLSVWLTARGIRRLIVAGVRTEQCCETTTRHASDCGYSVDFVSEATLTFAMTDKMRRQWSAAEIKARTELVLDGRFARVLTAEQCLADIDQTAKDTGRQAA